MPERSKRLRILAGPNGSGKSTIVKKIRSSYYCGYFVCTVSPAINIARVAQRVKLGGHDVPANKIESRYYSSLALLADLIPHTYHTYLFDNSSEDSEITLVAEIENGTDFILKADELPE
jgi:predicted ABC-type ATPase